MDDNQKKLIEEKFRENTGKLIKKARRNKGWKQAYLAEKVGVSPSVISDIENGKEDMPLSRLAVISHVLEMDSYLFKNDLLISEVLKALADYGTNTALYDKNALVYIPENGSIKIFAVKKDDKKYNIPLEKPTPQDDIKFNNIINLDENIEQKEALLGVYRLISQSKWIVDKDLQTVARAACRYAVNVTDGVDRTWMKGYYNKCRYGG